MSSIYLKRTNFRLLSLIAGGSLVAGYGLNKANQVSITTIDKSTPPNNSKFLPAGLFPLSVLPKGKSEKDFQQVYNAIAEKVREEDDADDGAGRYGLLCRLAWHSSGTFDLGSGKGGSYGGTMIYEPESTDPGNAGLSIGIEFLNEFSVKYPWLSRGDLWTLGGVVAVQEAGGPQIKWRPGRGNVDDLDSVPNNGFLPDASKEDGKYVKNLFARMGFDERETVALIGAHCLGKCHPDRSGFDGPWGPSFNMFTNDFFVRLLEGWHVRKWNGPKQYEDDSSKSFMMLPSDMVLKKESYFLKYVKMYAEDEQLFFKDFSAAYTKLLENGIDFGKQPYMTFKTLDDQDM
ncbi:cytochrome c peroxidase, mitochondrial [[Candida] jaroonii]|uniref:Cytochrome c peroxidase, mitochondrial n=1 Tax=[Candida] jaroonii TaxID=467808 RepID=A0ACA9YDI8_9ASCO|nr:cytochrome c peroxidase, mitochondrial [[Candida] jaroonii]